MSSELALSNKRIWVVGHKGMVGSAIMRRLASEGCHLLTVDRTSLDLRRQHETEIWMQTHKPDYVILAAATVGGIIANNTRPAEFIYDNLAIETNIIHTAWKTNVRKLLFIGSSCIYPKFSKQPIPESELLTAELEPTNQWYAIAKIAGIKLCQAYRRQYGCDYIAAMPTNLYGPGDNFHPEHSHVIPGIMSRMHQAKLSNHQAIDIWGTGKPRREFLFVEDLADALIFLLKNYSEEDLINVGTGIDITIEEMVKEMASVIQYQGAVNFDTQKPDGTPRKLLDISKLSKLGWTAKMPLFEGLKRTYRWYQENLSSARK